MTFYFSVEKLNSFVVSAKTARYEGQTVGIFPHRPGSIDIQFWPNFGDFRYLLSRFGLMRDYVLQEIVYIGDEPVWAMNTYCRLSHDDFSRPRIDDMIDDGFLKIYKEGRFLGGGEYSSGKYAFLDANQGDVLSFFGKATITFDGEVAFDISYHGGVLVEGWHIKANKYARSYSLNKSTKQS
jgi:hypothetical protein